MPTLDAKRVRRGATAPQGLRLGTSAGREARECNPGNELHLLVAVNDDAAFADGAEDASLSSPITAPPGVTTTATGAVRVLAPQGVVMGPVR